MLVSLGLFRGKGIDNHKDKTMAAGSSREKRAMEMKNRQPGPLSSPYSSCFKSSDGLTCSRTQDGLRFLMLLVGRSEKPIAELATRRGLAVELLKNLLADDFFFFSSSSNKGSEQGSASYGFCVLEREALIGLSAGKVNELLDGG